MTILPWHSTTNAYVLRVPASAALYVAQTRRIHYRSRPNFATWFRLSTRGSPMGLQRGPGSPRVQRGSDVATRFRDLQRGSGSPRVQCGSDFATRFRLSTRGSPMGLQRGSGTCNEVQALHERVTNGLASTLVLLWGQVFACDNINICVKGLN